MSARAPVLAARAPGKVNLCLFLGGIRADGRHELVSVMESLSLADELRLEPAPPGASRDEVVCPGVPGENLAARALALFRARTGWDGPPVRLSIEKRVPVAAGMGGGSGDAAAALRLAALAAGRPDDVPALTALAPALGADVPAQVVPGRVLARGAGERLEPLPAGPPYALLVLPSALGLSTADVFRAADRLGLERKPRELDELAAAVRGALGAGGELPDELVVNDLEPAALSLRPSIRDALAAARDAGARHALVSGSGPTVFGMFPGADGEARAAAAAAALAERWPRATVARPVDAAFAAARPVAP